MNVDVAIVGGGAAGLTAALSLPLRLKVAVFAKRELPDCASALAQGGIAAALSAADGADAHLADTLRAGDGLCDTAVARAIVGDAPAAIAFLSENGVRFNRDSDGGFALGREGGHSARRIAHVDDATGAAVVSALGARVRGRKNIRVREHCIAVNLFSDGVCRGFYALDLARGKIETVNARAVILASGGACKAYLYATTPPDATGDGVAMAYRAGCRIVNMEFVQFHPTCLYHPLSSSFLITEAVRGEGARLRGGDGNYFMENSGADELSPRDAVARAIDAEMKGSGADCVYLDLSAHPPDFWRRRFPTVMRRCESLGLDAAARIPVVPAAHYCCGGIRADLDGRTDLPALFAVGETACGGLHGANRLASNSLLECVAAARRAAEAASAELRPRREKSIPPWDERRISPAVENMMVAHNWDELRRLMWNYVGVARSDERLIRARRRIELLGEEIEEYYRRHAISRDFLELRNLTQCAELIIEGALARRESRGLHFNINRPEKSPRAENTILCREDFVRRRRAVNRRCPFSGRPVVAGGLADYRGRVAGFCNADCRDRFAAAAADGFSRASAEILSARDQLNSLIDGGGVYNCASPPPRT
ncbi:MAG: L-aspartate oxidase [Gammaproteobacteria bacterium]